jgi:N-acetylmuramoyl-L-alanine amidase
MRKTIRIITAILVMALLLAFPAMALSPGTARVTGDALRFRAGPSLDAEILGWADKGTVVEILEDLGEWCRVSWEGQTGYMSSRYLEQLTVAEPESEEKDDPALAPTPEPEPEPTPAPTPEPEPTPAPTPKPEPEPLPAPSAESVKASGKEEDTGEEEESQYPCVGVLTGNAVRFRALPSLEADVYDFFNVGRRVTVLGLEEDWYRVEVGGKIGYLFSKYVRLVEKQEASSLPEAGELAQSVIQLAKDNLGVPYSYGGASPTGFDCSGLVYYCFLNSGVKLNRTASGQYTQGVYVEKDELEPGDLVFFVSPGTWSIGHVGIYIGDGQFIHASTGSHEIVVSELSGSYWTTNYYGARRITD